jgi:hypothetical protein
MKRHFLPIFACLLCLPFRAVLAAPVPAAAMPSPDGQRFLFIVDTSSGMEKLKEQNETAIYELLRGGLFGQMQRGDTFGLWTFDKETYAGRFPMQIWEPRRASQLGTIAAAYLSGHPYDHSTDMKRLGELLTSVVHAASNLNVLILSDGGSALRGTPFDKAINAEYRKKRRDRNSAKQPFVTTLIALNGAITNYSVVIAGQPILLPQRPMPEAPVATKASPSTNRPAGVLLSITPVSPATGAVISTTNAQHQAPPASTPASLAPITLPPSNAVAKSETASRRVVQIVTKSNGIPATTEPATNEPDGSSATLASDTTVTNIAATVPSVSGPASPASGPIAESPAVETSASRASFAQLLPEPIVVAAREIHPDPAPPNPAPIAAVQATALPAPQGPGAGMFLAIGSLLMAAACFLLFVVFRRLRPAPGASLITQSMERR